MAANWDTCPMRDCPTNFEEEFKSQRRREDSGVHTAQNSSDSERNSPVQLEGKESEQESLLRSHRESRAAVNI